MVLYHVRTWLTYPSVPSIDWPAMTLNIAKFERALSSLSNCVWVFVGVVPSGGKKCAVVPTATKKFQKARTAICLVCLVLGFHFLMTSSATTLWAVASNLPDIRAFMAVGLGRPR